MRGSGLALSGDCVPWGGFAGATLQKRQSGCGHGPQYLQLENVERTVNRGPVPSLPRAICFVPVG